MASESTESSDPRYSSLWFSKAKQSSVGGAWVLVRLTWLHAIWPLLVLGLRGKLSIPSCLCWPSILIAWQVGQGTEAKTRRVEASKDELGCFPVSPPPPSQRREL